MMIFDLLSDHSHLLNMRLFPFRCAFSRCFPVYFLNLPPLHESLLVQVSIHSTLANYHFIQQALLSPQRHTVNHISEVQTRINIAIHTYESTRTQTRVHFWDLFAHLH